MAPKRRKLPKLSDRIRLGPFEVSPVCLGMVTDPAAVLSAYEAGVNFFFLTADMHWPHYEPARRGLAQLLRKRGVRDRVVVAAAAYVTQPAFCSMPFEEVIEAVPGLGHLDVAVAGGAYWANFFARVPVYLGHRQASYCGIGAFAASFHERSLARAAIERSLVDAAFVRFNPGHPGAERDLLPHLEARARTAKVFAFKSTDRWVSAARMDELEVKPNYWRPQVTDHYRFVLSAPGIDGVLCSLDSPGQVRALSDALGAGALSEDERKYLVELSELAR